jgi:hypothetical protein
MIPIKAEIIKIPTVPWYYWYYAFLGQTPLDSYSLLINAYLGKNPMNSYPFAVGTVPFLV